MKKLGIAAIYIAFLVMHGGVTSQRAAQWAFPNDTDEIQHLSLAYQVKESPTLFLKYPDLKVLAAPAFQTWGEEGNYLVHPSLYYHLIGFFLPDDETMRPAFLTARYVNVGVSTLALLVIFMAGASTLVHPRHHLIFAATVTLCPMIGGLGGQINNDNLALLGGALVLAGLSGTVHKGSSPSSSALMALGFAVGCWTKLIAGMLLGAWIVLVYAFIFLRRPDQRPSAVYGVVLVAALVVGISPYAYNLFAYGAPLYDTAHFYADAAAPRLSSVVDYMGWFFYALSATWVTNQPADVLQLATLVLVLGLSVTGAWRGVAGKLRGREATFAILAAGALGAVALVIPIHFVYAYEMHLETGIMSGPVFRYYLAIWAGVAAGAAVCRAGLHNDRIQQLLPGLLIVLLAYSAIMAPAIERLSSTDEVTARVVV